MENKRIKLLEIYLEDDSINYEFNLEEEEIIIANNMLLCGVLLRIQKNILDLDQFNPEITRPEEIEEENTQNSED